MFLEISQNSQENICTRVSFLIKLQVCNLIKKETVAQVFSCEFCEISKNTFFYKTPLVAASENNVTMQTTAKFASNSTANIKLSKHLSFFSLHFEQVLYEKWKCSRKKIMRLSSCSESTPKTNLLQLIL